MNRMRPVNLPGRARRFAELLELLPGDRARRPAVRATPTSTRGIGPRRVSLPKGTFGYERLIGNAVR